jgi:hypothetical protein
MLRVAFMCILLVGPAALAIFSGVMAGHSPSKTGVNALMSRPSTPCLLKRRKKGVDARDERGHDGGGLIQSYRNAPQFVGFSR